MRNLIFLFIGICVSTALCSQPAYDAKRDYMWKLGYSGYPGNIIAHIILDFSDGVLDTNYIIGPGLDNYAMNGSMCDTSGNLLFYSNGCAISDSSGQIIPGAGDLNPGTFSNTFCENDGYTGASAMLMLPVSQNDFSIMYMGFDWINFNLGTARMTRLYHGKLHVNVEDNSMIYDNTDGVVLADTFFGIMSSCRHANGRDWWVLIPELRGSRYYRYLVNPDGVHYTGGQYIGKSRQYNESGTGMIAFSPAGTKFIQYSLISDIQIFDFDRCTGELSNPVYIPIQDASDTIYAAGVAVSPNSRYLYATSSNYIYQFDLQAADIGASKLTVAVYDGYYEDNEPMYTTRFYIAQPAPDGKIYVTCPGGRNSIHVIEHPDSAGLACQVVQHKYYLPAPIGFGLPNHPNFRLGPLVGSACDTLSGGPEAAFGVSGTGLSVSFRDSSRYGPDRWHWDFGDGNVGTARHPEHTYAVEGTYSVCLRVSSAFGADTLCKEILVQTSEVQDLGELQGLSLWPNPTSDAFHLATAGIRVQRMALFSTDGRFVLERVLPDQDTHTISTAALTGGIYLLQISDQSGRVWSKKLVVIK